MDAPLALTFALEASETAPSLLERYVTILFLPLIGLAIVLLPFIIFVLYTWWSQRHNGGQDRWPF